jgi:hypothetical protein
MEEEMLPVWGEPDQQVEVMEEEVPPAWGEPDQQVYL